MSPEIWAGRLGDLRGATTSTGISLSTTAAFGQFPALAQASDSHKVHLFITPRGFSSANVARFLLNPWLTVLKTTDSMSAAPTNYSIQAQDNSTSTSVDISSLDTEANGDWLLVGSHKPFGGAALDVDDTNSTGSRTLTIAYWNGSAWTSYTLSYSVTWTTAFDADTTITWTVASGWKPSTFKSIYPEHSGTYYFSDIPMYWTKWTVNGALDSSVTLDHLLAVNRSTTYFELLSGQPLELQDKVGFGGLGCVQAVTDTGTGRLVVNLAMEKDGEY